MKMGLDRRSFLASTTGALSLSLLPLKLLATAAASKAVPPAPVARVEVAPGIPPCCSPPASPIHVSHRFTWQR
jgi:hypothetical protein